MPFFPQAVGRKKGVVAARATTHFRIASLLVRSFDLLPLGHLGAPWSRMWHFTPPSPRHLSMQNVRRNKNPK